MKYLLLICAVLVIGCNVQKRQVEKMNLYALRYQPEFKVLANQLAPCYDGTSKSDTVIIHGKPDTLFTPGKIDTVRYKDTVRITKTLPGKQIKIPVTKIIRDTVIDKRALGAQEAKFKIVSDSLVATKTKLDREAKTASKYQLYFWLLVAGIGIAGVIWVYRQITSFNIKKFIK